MFASIYEAHKNEKKMKKISLIRTHAQKAAGSRSKRPANARKKIRKPNGGKWAEQAE